MITIGSTAIKHFFPDFPRVPKDLDIAVKDTKGLKKSPGVEYLENKVIFKYQQEGMLRPELLLSLKVSHMFWDNNWEKHLFDIQFLLKKGLKVNLSLVEELIPYWKEILPKVKRSELKSTKKDFFTNAVNEGVEEHDYLHTLLNPIPMYTKLLKEGCEVELDPSKWDLLTFEERCDVVFEETAVMSYERYKGLDYRIGYKRQLKDNILKHFPVYIAVFAIENYPSLERPKYDYITKIRKNGGIN